LFAMGSVRMRAPGWGDSFGAVARIDIWNQGSQIRE
jgi:hypothetical protein